MKHGFARELPVEVQEGSFERYLGDASMQDDLSTDERAEIPARARRRRWRVWEIHRGIHGALLALSFNQQDLQRLLRRAGVAVAADARFYDIHRHLCEACVTRNAISERIDKFLNQKFARSIITLRAAADESELSALWREAWAKGRGLPSLFWAFLSHPSATEELRADFYADVHALFFGALIEREALHQTISTLESRVRALEKRYAADVSRLRERLRRRERQAAERERVEAVASDHEVDDAAQQVRALDASEKAARRRAERAEERIRTLEARLRRIRQASGRRPNPAPDANRDTLPAATSPDRGAGVAPVPGGSDPGASSVGGRVLYVGGRAGMIDKIRAFCEAGDAQFLHHDGGIEDSSAKLDQMLGSADVVFFPVDCVSHEAALRVKAFCKRYGRPAVPLRSASITAFRKALQGWGRARDRCPGNLIMPRNGGGEMV